MSGLFDPTRFRSLVSGQWRGVVPTVLRAGLAAAERPYTWAVARRNRWYDAHPEAAVRVGVPVVSVGNITLGGTGKTPLVEWLVRWLSNRGVRPVIVSRGYGARRGQPNDEALELSQKLPGVTHVQNPDRVAAAREAISHHAAEAIVLDDAFQHRRIARDLDIVLLDALEPFGFERVFPRGTLREPLAGLRRADVVILSRANLVDPPAREEIRRRAAALSPAALWLEAAHRPLELVARDGRRALLAELRGRRVVAFCGIGNPAAFGRTLADCGVNTAATVPFPDHHAFGDTDLNHLARLAESHQADALVCTEKDLVKLRPLSAAPALPLWAVRIGLSFLSDTAALESRLRILVRPRKSEI